MDDGRQRTPDHGYTISSPMILGFYVSPTAKIIRRRDLGLKSHPKDWNIQTDEQKDENYKPVGINAGSIMKPLPTSNKNIKTSYFKSSVNIQNKEGGPDRSVSDNQSSSVTLNELAMKARKDTVISSFSKEV